MVPWKIANYVVGDEEHSNKLTLTNAFVNIVVVFETVRLCHLLFGAKEKYFYFVTKKYFQQSVLLYFYLSTFNLQYFLLLLRYF